MNNPDPVADTRLRERTEIVHIIAQVVIVGAAMLLVYGALDMVIHKLSAVDKASDVVAIIGAVTTFLGTAVGLFFGVSAGQTGKKSADQAAQTAQSAAQTAAKVAQQAQDMSSQSLAVAQTAQSAAREAISRSDAFRPQVFSFTDPQAAAVRSAAATPQDTTPTTANVVDVKFTFDSNNTTAHGARVYLPGSDEKDDIASEAKPTGSVPRQVVGSKFKVVVEVQGNPDDVGVFTVENAIPPTIKLKVSDGPVAIQPIIVTG